MKFRKIVCIIDPRTVLNIKVDKKADAVEIALEKLKEMLKDLFVAVIGRQHNSLSILAGEGLSKEIMHDCRNSLISLLETKSVMLKDEEIDDEEAAKYTGEIPVEKSMKEEKDTSDYSKDKIKQLCKTAHEFIGADEFKKLVDDICLVADYYTDKKVLSKILCGMSYLFSVNKGAGRTTLAKHLGLLVLNLLGYDGKVNIYEHEITDSASGDGSNIIPVLQSIDNNPLHGTLDLHVLHIDSMQNKFNSTTWLNLMEAVENNSESRLYIFMVPYLEDIVLDNIHKKINDNISNRVVVIPPFTNDMYIEAFKLFFKEYNVTLNENAHDAILKKIAEEKSDGNFRGMNTVRKIVSEALYYKAQNPQSIPGEVTSTDIEILLDEEDPHTESGFSKLESLVSLKEVKEKVREILATIKLKKEMGETGAISMHMMFSGAPGTGKTVVARLIGQIFKEEKVLTKGDFYEVTRKDMVGSFVGHTAPKTAEICKSAYGSVLFIDEAYSLANGGEKDFGKEAISTLIAEMENNRDNFIVILAGYENELEALFELNPGLRDRIPYHIDFKSYTREELAQIFYMKIPKEFTYDAEFKECADNFFLNLPDEIMNDPNFSNGRYVRNLIERIFSKSALRVMMDPGAKRGLLIKSDFTLAAGESDFSKLNKKDAVKKKIGF